MATQSSVARGRWFTPEFLFYYFYACIFYLLLIWRAVKLSGEYEDDKWRPWLRGLRQGWIPGRSHVDVSDSQWRNFREGLPLLTAVMAALTALSVAVRRLANHRGWHSRVLECYWLLASLAYVGYLHGACVVFILAFASVNYALAKGLGGSAALPGLLWAFNCGVLICNHVFDGYSFAALGPQFAFLDKHRGVFRWQICFNLVMLRMVSFGLDYHWMRCGRQPGLRQDHAKRCSLCQASRPCYALRQETGLAEGRYDWVAYLSYLLYAPLYIAGPILTYNAYASQMEVPQQALSRRQVALYAARWLASLLLMELISHFCFFPALATSGLWRQMAAVDVCIIGYGVLNVMWLKFLLIWRYFRLWALVSGVEAPENMLRCVNNSCDIEGFWKGWHASYNRWLVRYLYIPLGGARWRALNTWVIFTFVAMWHDLEWKLLSWAWLTCLLGVPELLAKAAMRSQRMDALRDTWLYREICAVGGAISIAGLMCANLVGFVIGVPGLRLFLAKLLTWQNAGLVVGIFVSFYIGTKLMMEVRSHEVCKASRQESSLRPKNGGRSDTIPTTMHLPRTSTSNKRD